MEQKQLHAVEAARTQEEPPGCEAGCPLHVDGRALAASVAKGDWAQGWRVLRKTMPFPGILGRLCGGSCLRFCKLDEVGDPINMPGLELAVVSHPAPGQKFSPMPAKMNRIAVVGAGLSGLAAAWDLGHKGYLVTLFMAEDSLAEALKRQYPGRLSEKVVAAETEIFPKIKVVIEQCHNPGGREFFQAIDKRYDTICLCQDAVRTVSWPLPKNSDGEIFIDSDTCATGLKKVFVCPDHELPEFKAYYGRVAATSMYRVCQGVSLTAGRDRQGPFETPLYVDMKDVEPSRSVAMPQEGYSDEQAVGEAARCLGGRFPECVNAGPFFVFQDSADSPGAMPNAGFSARYEAGMLMRHDLLKHFWEEEPGAMNEYESIDIELSPEVRAKCENRRIMEEDIRKVLFHATRNGRMFKKADTGRFLAYYKPSRVTYWVEYEPGEAAGGKQVFVVKTAYSHRMVIPGDS